MDVVTIEEAAYYEYLGILYKKILVHGEQAFEVVGKLAEQPFFLYDEKLMDRHLKQLLVSSLHHFLQSLQDNPNRRIQHAFENRYPKALYSNWSLVGTYQWKVHFSWNMHEYVACFDKEGIWLETRAMILYDSLPIQVKYSFEKLYDRNAAIRIVHMTTPYEIQYKGNSKTLRLLFDIHGTLLKCNSLTI